MSYLLHGSTAHTGMGWVDVVPRTNSQLYIGGLYALYQTDLIQAAGTKPTPYKESKPQNSQHIKTPMLL
jgi:dual specificity phosphatase 12